MGIEPNPVCQVFVLEEHKICDNPDSRGNAFLIAFKNWQDRNSIMEKNNIDLFYDTHC